MKLLLSFLSLISLQTCISSPQPTHREKAIWEPPATTQKGLEKAYVAAGCFWCVEAIYESVKGVHEVYSGYAGGHTKNPNYNQIGTGRTGHAEAVEILYDPKQVSFGTLIQVFFGSHNPTTPNQQGPDRGSQYRSIAFYQNEAEREIIQEYIALLTEKKMFSKEIITEVKRMDIFYYAEEYHQNYERLNPNNPYVQNVSIPRLRRFQEMYPELLKANH
ncbi:MAG: peptide-methionine (S)-S-oxide reductase MsrA [Flavobacteriaceae bacterium]